MTASLRPKKIIGSLIFAILIATSVASVAAATVTQGFNTQDTIPQGAIVSLDKQASEVILASSANVSTLYGVVVREGDVSFSQGTNTNSSIVPVASGGVVETLVSNNNGPVNVGDPITVNDVAGIGEKATNSGKIIGIAQSALSEQDSSSRTVSIGQNGSQKNINIATIPVKIEVSDYASPHGSGNRNKILQVADSLVGKEVKPFGLVVSGLILLVCIFVSVFLITSSGYASMISIGRNPLSERKIIKSLLRMLGIALSIFVVGLLLSYAILHLL